MRNGTAVVTKWFATIAVWLLLQDIHPAAGRQLMEVGKRDPNGAFILSISCEGSGPQVTCAVAGSHVYRSEKKPMFAIGDPKRTCYLETALNAGLVFQRHGNIYISTEGPAGSMCMTQLIKTIDFASRSYTSRKFSDIHTGDICRLQVDETNNYSQSETSAPFADLNCSALEYIPSMWAP